MSGGWRMFSTVWGGSWRWWAACIELGPDFPCSWDFWRLSLWDVRRFLEKNRHRGYLSKSSLFGSLGITAGNVGFSLFKSRDLCISNCSSSNAFWYLARFIRQFFLNYVVFNVSQLHVQSEVSENERFPLKAVIRSRSASSWRRSSVLSPLAAELALAANSLEMNWAHACCSCSCVLVE